MKEICKRFSQFSFHTTSIQTNALLKHFLQQSSTLVSLVTKHLCFNGKTSVIYAKYMSVFSKKSSGIF